MTVHQRDHDLRRLHQLTALLVSSALLITAAACQPSQDSARPPDPVVTVEQVGRKLLTDRLDTLWRRGGTADDTLLLRPLSLAADSAQVYVFDAAVSRIVAFEAATGRMRWTFGRRGGGPGEFRDAIRLALAPDSGLLVLDRDNGRFYEITPSGRLASERPYHGPHAVSYACGLADGSVLTPSHGTVSGVLRIGRDGTVADTVALPWSDLDTIPGLGRQAMLVPADRGRDCIFAFILGRGFARLSSTRSAYAAPYVEPFELSPVHVERSGRRTSESFLPGTVYATFAASVDRDTLVIFFEGPSGPNRGRFADHYDATTGRYLYSRLLDSRVTSGARAGGVYFTIGYDEDYPSLIAVRPRSHPASR